MVTFSFFRMTMLIGSHDRSSWPLHLGQLITGDDPNGCLTLASRLDILPSARFIAPLALPDVGKH